MTALRKCKTRCYQLAAICMIMFVSLLVFGAKAAFARTFAYILLSNSNVAQFEVESGKFKPLARPVFTLDGESYSGMAVDPNGRFAYLVGGMDYVITECQVKEDGSLSLLGKMDIRDLGFAWKAAVDHSGRFLYVTVGRADGNVVLQYRINKDGSLKPLDPPAVKGPALAWDIVIHRTKPFVYVVTAESSATPIPRSSILQFKMGPSGALEPLNPPAVNVEAGEGGMAFGGDGQYLYVSGGEFRKLFQFKIKNDGTLDLVTSLGYSGYYSEHGATGTDTLVAPSGGSIFVTDSQGGGLHKFDVLPQGKPMVDDWYWIAGRRFVKDSKLVEQVKSDAAKAVGAKDASDAAVMDAYTKRASSMTAPFLLAIGPGGVVYGLSPNKIARFTVEKNGAFGWAMEPAYIFPGDWWKKYASYMLGDQVDIAWPRNFIIVQRK